MTGSQRLTDARPDTKLGRIQLSVRAITSTARSCRPKPGPWRPATPDTGWHFCQVLAVGTFGCCRAEASHQVRVANSVPSPWRCMNIASPRRLNMFGIKDRNCRRQRLVWATKLNSMRHRRRHRYQPRSLADGEWVGKRTQHGFKARHHRLAPVRVDQVRPVASTFTQYLCFRTQVPAGPSKTPVQRQNE